MPKYECSQKFAKQVWLNKYIYPSLLITNWYKYSAFLTYYWFSNKFEFL